MCLDFIKSLLPKKRRTDDEIADAKEEGSLWRISDGSPSYHIMFHSSESLRQWRGYWPEKSGTKALADALDEHGVGYEIEWALEETFDPPTEDPYDNDFETIGWAGEQDWGEADIHVLLVDDDGGVTSGDICIAGGRGIQRGDEPVESGVDDLAGALHTILHEVGHGLGVPGDADEATDRVETTGLSWVGEDGRWHRTAMNSTDTETTNACGDQLAKREGRTTVYHQRYHDCAVEYFNQ